VGLERYVSESDGQRTLRITAEHDCRRLHCAMRDLSSLLQALGRLADHFIGDDKFTTLFDDACMLVDRFCSVLLCVSLFSSVCLCTSVVRPYECLCSL